ncbi:hypothetical protein HYALB_00007260 [Hymenoscyphus albidus]|uniref:N-acetyltransferase domain-containing protein n=1 Tax=Hymenoscyphus albidus TaxID=595503 RepID=A0A9N9LHU9_9HELO|nr:hypothetical protein HYALB_00007260 [Hymenoscyphus albidus]
MTSLRPFHALDVFKFNPTNLDPLTETYDLNFYFSYLARWPHLFNVALSPTGTIDAYLMGKLESSPPLLALTKSPHYLPHHAHITALTVSPSSRRLGLARTLSQSLEHAGDAYNAFFVDLFVRQSNTIAQTLYKGMGYSVFRKVVEYYSEHLTDKSRDSEDAYDMRKSLARDVKREHVRENGEKYEVNPEDVW